MCNCPRHFDEYAECNCSCDHGLELDMGDIMLAFHRHLSSWDPRMIKILADTIRAKEEQGSKNDQSHN